jgi:hypothetical protein
MKLLMAVLLCCPFAFFAPSPLRVLNRRSATLEASVSAKPPKQVSEPLLEVTTTVDLGRDLGQNFGSLFEVKNEAGRVVAGAGFMAAYNTRFRMDRHTVQFFVRPEAGDAAFTLTRLPRPDDHCGLYMFDFDGKLFAINDSLGRCFNEWDPAAKAWHPARGPAAAGTSSNDEVTRLGRGVLTTASGRVDYDGRLVLAAPAEGSYNHFYYAQGRLFFYYTVRGDHGFTRLYACRWTPEDKEPIDLRAADTHTVAQVGEVSWAWGQQGKQIITVSNIGGIYVYNGEKWRVLRDISPGVSYQVYSMLNYYDRLLLGHYPTGEVFEFDGESVKRHEGWPPRLPGVSPSARECQTLSIYRGELFAGVWPWAEVWRFDREADRWHSMGRLFTHPALTDQAQHPYEPESVRHGLVLNQFGQRVTSMVTIGDSLLLSTSAKGNIAWDPKYADFLTEEQRREYGAVLQMKLPGNLAAPIQWKDGPTQFEFLLFADRMVIRQDGRELAATSLDPGFLRGPLASLRSCPRKIDWGHGIFGPLQGRLLQRATTGLR